MVTIKVLLGPVPCPCGLAVVWGTAKVRGATGKVNRWRDPITGRQHKCQGG